MTPPMLTPGEVERIAREYVVRPVTVGDGALSFGDYDVSAPSAFAAAINWQKACADMQKLLAHITAATAAHEKVVESARVCPWCSGCGHSDALVSPNIHAECMRCQGKGIAWGGP